MPSHGHKLQTAQPFPLFRPCSLHASPSPLRKWSSTAHSWFALSFTRDGYSVAASLPSLTLQLLQTLAMGVSHLCCSKLTPAVKPWCQFHLDSAPRAACELWDRPLCHFGIPQVQCKAKYCLPPAQTSVSPCREAAARSPTSSSLQPREASALNHLQRPARSCSCCPPPVCPQKFKRKQMITNSLKSCLPLCYKPSLKPWAHGGLCPCSPKGLLVSPWSPCLPQ